MNLVHQKMSAILKKWQDTGLLHVVYALLSEALLIGFVMFAALFTLETLLPTFVAARLSLTAFLAILIIGSFLLAALGRFLSIDFPSGLRHRNPILWVGIAWIAGILAISLYKFPLILIPVIILAFLGIGYLFLSVFFGEKE